MTTEKTEISLQQKKERIFAFSSTPKKNTHTALELHKRIQLGINMLGVKRDHFMGKILSLIDLIQRDMNAGETEKGYEIDAQFLSNMNDPSLKNDFVTTVKTLAEHRTHFLGKTKINWFGHTNNTKSIEKFKELFLQDPGLIVEDYPAGFFLAAQVQNLPEQHYKDDLKHAMSMLVSDGVHGAAKYYGEKSKTSFTKHQDEKVKSVRFGCCSVKLDTDGKLDIQFFKLRYGFTDIEKKEEEDSEQKRILFYNESNHSCISWKEHQKRRDKKQPQIPTSVSSTSLPSAPSASNPEEP